MGKFVDALKKDIRFHEGLKSCMNCGVCTAICPAASVYNYDPRMIVNIVQTHDEKKIEELLKDDLIWYCGQCMSCKTRCPRGNTPGFIIMALRQLSQDTGMFAESEKGRQQLAIKRIIGHNILQIGYCVYPDVIVPEKHVEQGPVWDWTYKNSERIFPLLGGNYKGKGSGALRKIEDSDLAELKNIFEITGALKRFEKLEKYSSVKAAEFGMELTDDNESEYMKHVSEFNSNKHFKE